MDALDNWGKVGSIEVDGGLAGIFAESVYRNDNTSRDLPNKFEFDDGRWRGVCCTIVVHNNGAGTLEGGVVSTSNRDGEYPVYIVEKMEKL